MKKTRVDAIRLVGMLAWVCVRAFVWFRARGTGSEPAHQSACAELGRRTCIPPPCGGSTFFAVCSDPVEETQCGGVSRDATRTVLDLTFIVQFCLTHADTIRSSPNTSHC